MKISGKELFRPAFRPDIAAVWYVLLGIMPAAASVYEQLQDGSIAKFADGIPSTALDDPQNKKGYSRLPAISAILLDETKSARSRKAVAAHPSQLGHMSLSSEQRRMQGLAAEVALSYAASPGVVRAQLDHATFVALFTAMINRESNFNPKAVSRAGAKGLGQLMPQTAVELGVCNVFSPRENLEGAATYLTAMLEKFGSPSLALAAYNAGPNAVVRHGGIPPYAETQQYVADIVKEVSRTRKAGAVTDIAVVAFDASIRSSDLSDATVKDTASSNRIISCRTKQIDGAVIAKN